MKVSLYRDGKPLRARTPTRAALADARNLGLLADGTTLDLWLLMVTNLRDAARHEPPPPPGEELTVKASGMLDKTGTFQAWLTSMGRVAAPAGCWDEWRHLGEGSRGSAAHQHQLLRTDKMSTIEQLTRQMSETAEENRVVLAECQDRIRQLEQRPNPKYDGASTGARTLGHLVAEQFQRHGDTLARSGRLRIEVKAAGDLVGTASGGNKVTGGVGAVSASRIGLQYALPRRNAPGITSLEYSRQTAVEGAAAQQVAEGDAKAYVRPTHSIVSQSSLLIAGLTVLSKQAMNDSAQLVAAVNGNLQRSVDVALDALLYSGGTGFAGYEALATAATSATYTGLADTISEGQAAMQVSGFNPDVVVMTPASWLALAVAKSTDGLYLSGSYLQPMPLTLRGLRVVLSGDLVAGKALLLDSSQVELLDVDVFTVEAGVVDDDFARNKVTLRAELRVLPTFMATGAMRLLTPKP